MNKSNLSIWLIFIACYVCSDIAKFVCIYTASFCLFNELCKTGSNRFAMSVTHIWILMAFKSLFVKYPNIYYFCTWKAHRPYVQLCS